MAVLTGSEVEALVISLKVAVGAVVVSAAPGVACGWLLARRDFPGKTLLDGLVHLPLVLPPVVTGYVLLLLLGRHGLLGGWLESALGVRLVFTTTGAMIAATVVAFPLLVRAVRLSMELIDPGLEEAARSLGAGPARTFLSVTLPLALPGVLAGLVLVFARSLGEFGATIAFAGNVAGRTRSLPLEIYTSLQRVGGETEVGRLVAISAALSLGALIVSELLARRLQRRPGGGA